mmetsp:Transcript_16122/g.35000  ORF Transcript_16122/g.35000 Transcript_16122/m.35000 type:complete len:119 (-) Transcript_16122:517-873(-)
MPVGPSPTWALVTVWFAAEIVVAPTIISRRITVIFAVADVVVTPAVFIFAAAVVIIAPVVTGEVAPVITAIVIAPIFTIFIATGFVAPVVPTSASEAGVEVLLVYSHSIAVQLRAVQL